MAKYLIIYDSAKYYGMVHGQSIYAEEPSRAAFVISSDKEPTNAFLIAGIKRAEGIDSKVSIISLKEIDDATYRSLYHPWEAIYRAFQ